jgi:hypothetical protein
LEEFPIGNSDRKVRVDSQLAGELKALLVAFSETTVMFLHGATRIYQE